jgi:hypothetical protein
MNYATVPTYFEYADEHSEIIFNHPTPIAFLLSKKEDKLNSFQQAFEKASVK